MILHCNHGINDIILFTFYIIFMSTQIKSTFLYAYLAYLECKGLHQSCSLGEQSFILTQLSHTRIGNFLLNRNSLGMTDIYYQLCTSNDYCINSKVCSMKFFSTIHAPIKAQATIQNRFIFSPEIITRKTHKDSFSLILGVGY